MLCKDKPNKDQTLICVTCSTPWHVSCLSFDPETLGLMDQFECPDCSGVGFVGVPAPAPSSGGGELIAKIRAIDSDASLTERQKAKKKQQLVSGKVDDEEEDEEGENKEGKEEMNEVLAVLNDSFMCAFCRQLPERPVTV